ncbi:hypothetical protein LOD99_8423 [Oopsacas minuta]|uniref:Transposase Tc1-like domain-containing protein n=1 Tax=Oopsacas minuta TaxID=111878 RepID=A0AAV7JGA3_9METZ|nr:hypothetical protein LOD99_8423 [Oopsacas minuta]
MSQQRKRLQIETLLISSGLSVVQISKKLGVSLATVYRVKSRKQHNVGLEHRKGAGRPSSLRLSVKRSVTQQIRHKPFLSLRTLASLAPGKPSHETVWRAMKDLDYNKKQPTNKPMINEKNQLARQQWAKKYKYPKKAWYQTVFIDKMSIWLARGRIKMWTKSGQKRIVPTTKHSPKINVWAEFSSMGTFPICIFTENMNSQMFVDILEGHLLTQAEIFHQNE